MVWAKIVPPPHSCDLPYKEIPTSGGTVSVGSIWKCEECGKHYKVVDRCDEYPGLSFMRMTDRAARRHLAK